MTILLRDDSRWKILWEFDHVTGLPTGRVLEADRATSGAAIPVWGGWLLVAHRTGHIVVQRGALALRVSDEMTCRVHWDWAGLRSRIWISDGSSCLRASRIDVGLAISRRLDPTHDGIDELAGDSFGWLCDSICDPEWRSWAESTWIEAP